MASFGVRLKQEREKQAVTLDDISLSTKISTRMLRALEEERFDQLPGGIFNKGFIRAYARCLGMDEEQAIADYLAATGITQAGKKSDNDEQAPLLEPPPREHDAGTAGLPWGIFAVALLIVALGFAGWGFYSRESQVKKPQAAAQPAPPSPNVVPATVAEPPPSTSDRSAAAAAIAKVSQPTVPSNPGSESAQVPASRPSVSVPGQSSPPAFRSAGFAVLIKARQDSWLSISIDGEVSTHSILLASTEKSVRATRDIVIRAGNVGALDFEFNGKKLPSQGDFNEAKTLTFDAHGLQPALPKPETPATLPSPAQSSGKDN